MTSSYLIIQKPNEEENFLIVVPGWKTIFVLQKNSLFFFKHTSFYFFQGHSKAVYPLVFIPDEKSELDGKNLSENDVLITGSSDRTIRIWSVKAARALHVSLLSAILLF